MTDPLIVTARLDPSSFSVLDGLRRRHFPPHLNRVPAHLSLFHHLPGEAASAVVSTVSRCCRAMAPLHLQATGARQLGRGVALTYRSAELARLHADLTTAFRVWLTPQDRQPFRAHVTIQNKVDSDTARRLYDALCVGPLPSCRIDGVAIWRYVGGPWEPVAVRAFGATSGGCG